MSTSNIMNIVVNGPLQHSWLQPRRSNVNTVDFHYVHAATTLSQPTVFIAKYRHTSIENTVII